jgi:hypothetical protein
LGATFKLVGSSRISGKRGSDSEKEVVVVSESVGHPLDDFDLVVDSLK